MDELQNIQNKLIKRNGIKKSEKKKVSDLDKYVIFSFTMIIMFTIVALIYQFVTDSEISSTLIMSFYGVFGGELLMLCMIKRLKLKKEDNDG